MKIAVLLPGLVRTWKSTFEDFSANLINPNQEKHQIDIYLAFWEKTDQKRNMRKGRREGENENIQPLSGEIIEEIIDSYRPKKYSILNDYDGKNKFFQEKGLLLEQSIGVPHHPEPKMLFANSVMAQSYVWNKCFSLISEDYDLIVKTRFDVTYGKPIIFDQMDPSLFNNFGKSGGKQDRRCSPSRVADLLFASNFKTMKRVMLNYHIDAINIRLPETAKQKPRFNENILYNYIKHYNIKIAKPQYILNLKR
jgi:hypothetical protein